MTKVVFETAALADAIRKAASVAPSRGEAYDKAAGIVIEIHPSYGDKVLVRATDVQIFYIEWVSVMEVEGEGKWRIPSRLISGVVSQLPIGSGKTTKMTEVSKGHGRRIELKSGRTKSHFNMMDVSDFPTWPTFDPDELSNVANLGGRLSQVVWATHDTSAPLRGVLFRGGRVVATDYFKAASAPLDYPEELEDLCIPAELVAPLLRQTGDVAVTRTDNLFMLMPNEFSQVQTVTFDAGQYPPLDKLLSYQPPNKVTVDKEMLIEMIARTQVFAGNDRAPTLSVYFGDETVLVHMVDAELGMLGDGVDVPGQAVHERIEYRFDPKMLTQALQAAPSKDVDLHYDATQARRPLRIDGGSGCTFFVSPRKKATVG